MEGKHNHKAPSRSVAENLLHKSRDLVVEACFLVVGGLRVTQRDLSEEVLGFSKFAKRILVLVSNRWESPRLFRDCQSA